MPPFGAIHRKDFIRYLKRLGFSGPYTGAKHAFMVRDSDHVRLFIPNPHRGEITKPLLAEILRQANVSREEWEKL